MITVIPGLVSAVPIMECRLTGERVVEMVQAWWGNRLIWFKTEDVARAIWGALDDAEHV